MVIWLAIVVNFDGFQNAVFGSGHGIMRCMGIPLSGEHIGSGGGDPDFQFIFTGLQQIGDVGFVGDPQLLTGINAIDIDLGNVLGVQVTEAFRKSSSAVKRVL